MVDRKGIALRIRQNRIGKRIEPHHKESPPDNIMNTAFSMWAEGRTLEEVRDAFPNSKHAYIGELRRIWNHLHKMEKADEDDRDLEFDWDLHVARDTAFVAILMAHGGHPVCTKDRGLIGHDGRPWRYRKPADDELAEFRKLEIKE